MPEMAAVVSWYGSYSSLADARKAARRDWDDGLYVAFGYPDLPIRGRPRFLYVGVGNPLCGRLTSRHHKLGGDRVARVTSVWLGEIDSHKRPGRRTKKIEPLIDAVEWAMVALLRPSLNERKTTWPDDSFAIMNRWWSKEDYETPLPKPVQIWPDLIECAGSHAPAYLCWLERRKVKRFVRPPRPSLQRG